MMNYEIAADRSWIRCGTCGRTSYNQNDVKMRYCGYCQKWLDLCCDFCSGHEPIVKDYQAAHQMVGVLSDGRGLTDGDGLWAACAECSALIERAAWDELIARVSAAHHWDEDTKRMGIFIYKAVFGDRFSLKESL